MNEEIEEIKNVPVKAEEDLDQKLKQELSLKDNKEDVRNVVQNAIEIKVGGMAANDEKLLNKLVENKATILKEQSKTELKINKHRNETETTEAITKKDKAFFERNKQLLEKANITEPCSKSYMMLMLLIIVPISFITNLLSLVIKIPFEILQVFATCIDALFIKIASFSKSAKIIAVSSLVILLIVIILWCIYSIVEKYNIVS